VNQSFAEPAASVIDALIVVDDSPSMAGRGDVVAAVAAELASTVAQFPGVVDLQMLVVTTSQLDHRSGECAHPPAAPPRCAADPFLRLTPTCGQRSNFSTSIPEAFACALAVGSAGCAVEQPLAAIRSALEGPFLRPSPRPFVLVITDEDDCSAPPGPLPFSVDSTEAEHDAPELAARCRQAEERAELVPVPSYAALLEGRGATLSVLTTLPAPRLEKLTQSVTTGSVHDLSPTNAAIALTGLGQRLGIIIGQACLPPHLVDQDAARAGVQPQCVVTEQTPDDTGKMVSAALPSCEAAAPPCWRVVQAPECTDSGLSWSIDHGGCTPPPGTQVQTSCAANVR
jgi:hypothetical protein